jgi:hypothetical protein
MSHTNPSGDLAVVLERAVDMLIADLEKKKLGKVARPPKPRRPSKWGYIPREVRREVHARDGGQCTFVDEHGRRCPARSFLELDHIRARALGGSGEAANIRLRCRTHNEMHAAQVFGRDYIDQRIHLRRNKWMRKSLAPVEDAVAATSAKRQRRPAPRTGIPTAGADADEDGSS